MTRPVRLTDHTVTIKAPRELVYQMMSSIGRGRLDGSSERAQVLHRDGNSVLAEFKSRVGLVTVTTVERVTLDPPERLTFDHVMGPFRYAREEFVLSETDGGTELRHSGEFIWSKIPLLGWVAGRLFIKRAFERVLERHMEKIKTAAELRFNKSHVFR